MLETLYDVNWAGLEHAYGAADDVPGLIKAVAFGSKSEADRAWYELYGNIWHQGTIYSATSHAVPFLLELVADTERTDTEVVLQYLQDLAEGTSFLDVHREGNTLFGKELTEEQLSQMRQELIWVEETREAVRVGLPVFEKLTDDSDPKVREAAASLIESIRNG